MENDGLGYLEIFLYLGEKSVPVENANIVIRDDGGNIVYQATTDANGTTDKIALPAPDGIHSIFPREPHAPPCFASYNVEVSFETENLFKKIIVHGVQIFDKQTSDLPIQVHHAIIGDPPQKNVEEIFIPREHGVDVANRNSTNISSRIVTSYETVYDDRDKVVNSFETPDNFQNSNYTDMIRRVAVPGNDIQIPNYITVHLGPPNAYARNVRVPFVEYIKNVASSEIYPTWEDAALYANILSQISFALNRIYTTWYRSRGYEFDITNSTAFDQFFVEGRNTFENINRIADEIFNNFIRRQGRREPFFAQYCNGTTATCNGLSQWGSQDLALQGYTPVQILKTYYPDDIQITESTNFSNNMGTYGGVALREGSNSNDVRTMQIYLNRIGGNYPLIPKINNPNGYFDAATTNATKVLQQIAGLAQDGIIGKATWYAITRYYVGVTRLAELDSEGERIGIGLTPPTSVLRLGSRGEDVVELDFLINYIAEFYPGIPPVIQNNLFDEETRQAVITFQSEFGLTPDGIVGPATWQKLYDVYYSTKNDVSPLTIDPTTTVYPGILLRVGSRSNTVALMQRYLSNISKVFPSIPNLAVDGIFGPKMLASVTAFQSLFGLSPDGIIGPATWDEIENVNNNLSMVTVLPYPGFIIRPGSRGNNVTLIQQHLNTLSRVYPLIPSIADDGIYGPATQKSVIAFQNQFGLTPDGIVGAATWNQLVSAYNMLAINNKRANMVTTAISHTNDNSLGKIALLMSMRLYKR